MTRQVLTEATQTTTATPVEGKPGRFLVQLISPGWGSSGYYSADVLEAAAKNRVFGKGTHQYLDHPTASEQFERPERSVRDLAAVLAEDAFVGDGGALVAEAQVFGPYRQVLDEMKDSIGVSIRAAAEVTEGGEAEGKRGRIIDALVEGLSADYVTHAGRGGKILQVLESAGHRSGSVEETTANDTRELLDQALRDTYGGEKSWLGVRDFDDNNVWFWWSTPDSEGCYQLGYSLDDAGAVSLSGSPIEVRPRTTYVPVSPAGQSTTQESKEDTMATTQIEESELARLREDAGRVTTLEAERDTARQERDTALAERDEAREANAAHDRDTTVARILGEAREAAGNPELNQFETAGVAARRVLADDGTVDEAATRTAFDTAIASIAESVGAGRVRGFGGKPPSGDQEAVSEADLDALDDAVFGEIKEA